jgi:hypothetical protein
VCPRLGPEHWIGEFLGNDAFLEPDSPRAAALRALFGQDAPPSAA